MSAFAYTLKYLQYYFTAQTKHDIHSPFVFDFVTNVINKKSEVPEFAQIEKLRKELLNNSAEINVTDFGTAFGGPKTYKRKISSITFHSAKSKRYGELLYRIVNYFKPQNLIELGTSLTQLYGSDYQINSRELCAWKSMLRHMGCVEITPKDVADQSKVKKNEYTISKILIPDV